MNYLNTNKIEDMDANMIRTISSGGLPELIGNKAYRLHQLVGKYSVPSGFIITTKAYDEWLLNKKLPVRSILKYLKYFRETTFRNDPRIIVRSSATVEDTVDRSFAGVFNSFSELQTDEEVLNSIKKVFETATSKEVLDFITEKGKNMKEIKIAAIVQQMVSPKFSGILFTESPTDPSKILIEFVAGGNEGLTQGTQVPMSVLIDREKLLKEKKVDMKSDYREDKEKAEEFAEDLSNISLEIESLFDKPQDIEWAYEDKKRAMVSPIPAHLSIFQSRDIVSKSSKRIGSKEQNIKIKDRVTLEGTTASYGYVEGVAQFISSGAPPSEAIKVFKKGNILVTDILFIEYYPIFKLASGIVTKVNTILAHPAIAARELGIPCVVGVHTEYIKDGSRIIINADKGKVILNDSTKILLKRRIPKVNREVKSTEGKRIREEYIEALNALDNEGLDNLIIDTFKSIMEHYQKGEKDIGYELYHLINDLMEINTAIILSKKLGNGMLEVLSRADAGKEAKNREEKKLFDSYRIIKKHINYQSEESLAVYKMLYGTLDR